MFKRKLACSFCGKGEADVAKLVAGPRVYICDRCAAEVMRIMDQSSATEDRSAATPHGLFRTVRVRVRRWWHGGVRRTAAHHAVA
jgi:ATP-dependent Clp protease ATP-binding subunit ClpX